MWGSEIVNFQPNGRDSIMDAAGEPLHLEVPFFSCIAVQLLFK